VAVHRRLAYVPGEARLWPSLTGEETLHLLARVHGQVDTAYRDDLVERFELDPGKRVRAYSTGNRQKLALVGALMTRADLLVLDEPTAGLDPLMEQVFRACVREAQGRGQTVFLSSHVLAEVEALCERVAILRAGHLVEVGSLDSMRLRHALSVEASFDGAPVPDLSAVPGVSGVGVEEGVLRCRVDGPVGPLLEALSAAGATRVISREPSLEELFLTYYGEGSGDPAARAAGVHARSAG
jgi:ABC-2 type transport system ATP-binding protein